MDLSAAGRYVFSRRLLIRWKCHVAPQPHKPQDTLTVCFHSVHGQWLNSCTRDTMKLLLIPLQIFNKKQSLRKCPVQSTVTTSHAQVVTYCTRRAFPSVCLSCLQSVTTAHVSPQMMLREAPVTGTDVTGLRLPGHVCVRVCVLIL